jgi:hypothetical protein
MFFVRSWAYSTAKRVIRAIWVLGIPEAPISNPIGKAGNTVLYLLQMAQIPNPNGQIRGGQKCQNQTTVRMPGGGHADNLVE